MKKLMTEMMSVMIYMLFMFAATAMGLSILNRYSFFYLTKGFLLFNFHSEYGFMRLILLSNL